MFGGSVEAETSLAKEAVNGGGGKSVQAFNSRYEFDWFEVFGSSIGGVSGKLYRENRLDEPDEVEVVS